MDGAVSIPPVPTTEKVVGAPDAMRDAAHAVRLAMRWRKPLVAALVGFCGLVLSAAGYYAHHLLAVEGWERVAATQKAHGETLAEHGRRLTFAEHAIERESTERRADVKAITDYLKVLADGQRRIEGLLDQLLLRWTPIIYPGAPDVPDRRTRHQPAARRDAAVGRPASE